MRTTRLPTVRASVGPRCWHQLVGIPQINKSDDVSSRGHQRSLAGRPGLGRVPVQWGPNASLVMVTWNPFPCGQTDTTENIIFLQLRWRTVMISSRIELKIREIKSHLDHLNSKFPQSGQVFILDEIVNVFVQKYNTTVWCLLILELVSVAM